MMDIDEADSQAPVVIKRSSKSSTKARSRLSSSSVNASPALSFADEGDDGGEESGTSVVKTRTKKKSLVGKVKDRANGSEFGSPRSKGKGRERLGGLSFGADEETDRDVSFSLNSARPLLRPSQGNFDPTNSAGIPAQLSQGSFPGSDDLGEGPSSSKSLYSKEALAQLKASNLETPSSLLPAASASEEYDELTRSKFGSSRFEEDTAPSEIPTVAAITAAKQKRELLRSLGATAGSVPSGSTSEEFISLSASAGPTKRGDSRLVREDDELGEGDDEGAEFTGAKERIALGKKARKEEESKRREERRDMIIDAEEDVEEDEEAQRWELEQVRRGARMAGVVNGDSGVKAPYRPALIPTQTPLPTLNSVQSRLSSTLARLTITQDENVHLGDQCNRERAELVRQETELRGEIERVEEKLEWFVEFRDWIEDVAGFLDEKASPDFYEYPLLEKVEKDNLSIQKERLDLVMRRRLEDDSDDISLFTGVEIPTPKLDTSSNADDRRKDDTDAMDEDDEGDDMGRMKRENDTAPHSVVRQSRRNERGCRIQMRRDVKSQSGLGSSKSQVGAEDDDLEAGTDDELSRSDALDLQDALTSLSASVKAIFDDVKAEEFRDPNLGFSPTTALQGAGSVMGVRKRFEEWRRKFPEEFGNAFGGLAMVGVWEFWARWEMAAWNPFGLAQLPSAPVSMESYSWHSSLSSFSHPSVLSADGEDEPMEEPDLEVVSGMISTVVLPKVEKFARQVYDPLSRTQTRRALGVVEEVGFGVERGSAKFQSLVLAFLSPFQVYTDRVQSMILPHVSNISSPLISLSPESIASRSRFTLRQIRLLENALKWKNPAKGVSVGGLKWTDWLGREVVEKILIPLVEGSWETGGREMAQKVLGLMTPDSLREGAVRRLRGGA